MCLTSNELNYHTVGAIFCALFLVLGFGGEWLRARYGRRERVYLPEAVRVHLHQWDRSPAVNGVATDTCRGCPRTRRVRVEGTKP